jgi:hypothetical protein
VILCESGVAEDSSLLGCYAMLCGCVVHDILNSHGAFIIQSLKIKALQSCEMSESAHTLTQNHFPVDFKSSVENFIVHVCVAAGTNMCIFQLINVLSDRNLFTRHAVHMNSKGK